MSPTQHCFQNTTQSELVRRWRFLVYGQNLTSKFCQCNYLAYPINFWRRFRSGSVVCIFLRIFLNFLFFPLFWPFCLGFFNHIFAGFPLFILLLYTCISYCTCTYFFLKFQSFMRFSNNNKNDGRNCWELETLRGRQHYYKNSTLSAKMDRALSNSHILFIIEKQI